MSAGSNYESHIDGIRCLAILPVLLNHVIPSACPGGFLGVDVFFVVSGYLICGSILREISAGSFSISNFYFRRIRRIFPAYFALVFAVLAVGVVVFHWAKLLPLAQTSLFSGFFSTNVYFWLTMGYFQPQAHDNPLLHLWSLGVEEHFYLVIPFLFLFLGRVGRIRVMIGLAAVLSLLACVLLGHSGQSTTAFYMLPTRAWELLAGAMLCGLSSSMRSPTSIALSILGGLGVLVSYWSLTTEGTSGNAGTSVEIIPFGDMLSGPVPFPGLVSIPVVAGSMLLIRYGSLGAVGRVLTLPVLTGVGKISYSLYLWHWPILVFTNYFSYGELRLTHYLSIFGLSFLCAYLSWRWIETPTRRLSIDRARLVFGGALGATFVLVCLCGLLITTEGLRTTVNLEANRYVAAPRAFLPNLEKLLPARRSFESLPYPDYDREYVEVLGDEGVRPTFCIVGDSHAEALVRGFGDVAKERGKSGFYIKSKVHPFVDENEFNRTVFTWVADRPDIEEIYLVGRWMNLQRVNDGMPELGDRGEIESVVLPSDLEMSLRAMFLNTAKWFGERGKRVRVFTCVPEYVYWPCEIRARSEIVSLDHSISISESDYRSRQAPVTKILSELAEEELLTIVPLGDAFIENGESVYMSASGVPFYRDGDHLTEVGARVASDYVALVLWPEAGGKELE